MSEHDFAVVIGINRYGYLDKDRQLEGPMRDAEGFHRWLLDKARLPDAHVKLVLSRETLEPEDWPIWEDINRAFSEVRTLARQGHARRLYVYFSGHGTANAKDHVALMMANVSRDNPGYAIDAHRYLGALVDEALFSEIVMLYDCCRNRGLRVQGLPPPWAPLADDRRNPAVTSCVLFGTLFGEPAFERPLGGEPYRRGLFTQALLEGLHGRASVSHVHGASVTFGSLKKYVRMRVKELTRAQSLDQNVEGGVIDGRSEDEIVLYDTFRPQRFPVRLANLESNSVSVWGGSPYHRVATQTPIGNEAIVELELGEYKAIDDATKRDGLFVVGGAWENDILEVSLA